MLEYDRYNWARLRSASSAAEIPKWLEVLRQAGDEASAENAYWHIDNEVVVQGSLYEAALPTAECAAIALCNCTDSARPWIIQLLYQLATGYPDPSEIQNGNEGLLDACRREVCRSAVAALLALDIADSSWLDYAIDLAIICAEIDTTLRLRVEWYLRRLLARGVPHGIAMLINNWLSSDSC